MTKNNKISNKIKFNFIINYNNNVQDFKVYRELKKFNQKNNYKR